MVLNDQLTSRQQEIFDLIRDRITDRGYGPTVREIGEQFGIRSPNGVMCHLKALEKKGFIHRSPNKSRAIELTAEKNADDVTFEKDGAVLITDDVSLPFLNNAEIDYVSDMMKSAFKIRNPNAAAGCGCGKSFSVKN